MSSQETKAIALEMKNVSKRFGSVVANKNVDLTVYHGEILAILGENGCGKTTLMNMISGIYYPDEGQVFVDGKEVYSATENIPVTKSKIMMNAWCGIGVDGWLKKFDDSKMPLTAEYEWVKFTPFE